WRGLGTPSLHVGPDSTPDGPNDNCNLMLIDVNSTKTLQRDADDPASSSRRLHDDSRKSPESEAIRSGPSSDLGDNDAGPGRSRDASFLREGGTVIVGADRRSTRAAFGIALLVMAIQGLTPDCANLASPWLLRLVTAVSVDGRASGDDLS